MKVFFDTFDLLALKTGRTFVIESYPVPSNIPVNDEAVRRILSHPSSGSAEHIDEANIGAIALAFDLICQFDGDIVILRKRFSRPEDLPDVTYGEAEKCLSDSLRVGSLYHRTGTLPG